MPFTPRYTRTFIRDLRKYAALKKSVLDRIGKIISGPDLYTREKLRGKTNVRKLDLTGLRSSEVRGKYRIIFVLCKDCVTDRLRDRGVFFCDDCAPDADTIIFLAFGNHDDAYLMK